MKAHAGSFDFILCTASGKMDVAAYMALLKPRKSFCLVGLPPVAEPLNFFPFNVVGGEKQIIGSMIGGVKSMKEMLEFSAAHKCFPKCEIIPFEEANAGFAKILAGAARYRFMQAGDNLRQAFLAQDAGCDGLAPGRFAGHAADGHFAPLGE